MNALAEYDDFVAQLLAAGVAEFAAHKQARFRYPDAAAQRANADEQRENVLEKDEQREVVKLFRAFGFKVRNLSQARASKQAPGLSDLWCVHEDRPIAFWWETKRSVGGRYSEAQIEFRDDCLRCGVRWGSGDRRAARSYLITLGLARVDGDSLEPVRVR